MDSGVMKGMKKSIQVLGHLACTASIIPTMSSTSFAQTLHHSQFMQNSEVLSSHLPERLASGQNQEVVVNTLPIQVEMILSERDWIRPSGNKRSEKIPVRVRITNLSDAPIAFPNYAPQAFFNFSIVDRSGRSMIYPLIATSSDGSAPHVGDAFSQKKYGACPILEPYASIENDWNLKLDWSEGEVVIAVELNPILQTNWRFKASHAASYKLQLHYEIRDQNTSECQGKSLKSPSSNAFLGVGKAESNISEVNIRFNPR